MPISRRELLKRASALGVTTVVPASAGCPSDPSGATGTDTDTDTDTDSGEATATTGGDGLPTYEFDGEPGPDDLFQHSVASGDPLTDSVILWSRVTGAPAGTVEAFYEVALDPSFADRVAAAYVETGPERDYTIKIDLAGLEPGTTYYYRFYSLGRQSPTGRTRTAPVGPTERMRIAVASCASLAHGYFHAYQRIGERADLSLVIHLGDYIYEYGNGEYGELRTYEPPTEIVMLDDYRTRYAQYRREQGLQECHRQHPMVVVWDDHETANNSWSGGAENHQTEEGDWEARKAVAYQAFAEWLPIREGAEGIIYRSLAYGDLLHVIMLDTRIAGRDEQVPLAEIDDPMRQLLGAEQEGWLAGELQAPAQWKLLAQQVMVAQLRLSADALFNLDQWDGYPAARQRLFEMIRGVSDVVVITGDIHSSWAFELADDPYVAGYESIAVEFVGPSVTSEGFPSNTAAAFMETNPHMKWGELVSHGYMLLDITAERMQCSWWFVDDVENEAAGAEAVAAAWRVDAGTTTLIEDSSAAPPLDDAPPLAP
jgi:alkaline phosphatase D